MELKVHVDNTIRTVCGLSQYTTVEEIIKALVHSIKQCGNFVLIENFQTNKLRNRRLPRIMSPDEKPIEIIFSYIRFLDNDEDIEFHLVRTNEPQSSEEDENLRILIEEIDAQQKILDQQNKKLELILKEINDSEESNLDLIKNNEIKTQELAKRKLLILDLKRCLNQKKINKLESNKEEFDQSILNREVELSLFLNAQHDYYKRKLDLTYQSLTKLDNDYLRLKSEYNILINSLPQIDHQNQHSNLKNQLSYDFIESNRQHEENKSKIIYLEKSSSNLDDMINTRTKIIENLEAEYNNLLNCENILNKINSNKVIEFDKINPFETSSSSECMSDETNESNASITNCTNSRPIKEINAKSAHYSRIRRLTRYDKSPARLIKKKYDSNDIHYF